jgi:biopolymer transport protein ExbD
MSLQHDRSYHAAPQAVINVTPLIDVMLALVVVFMIAAPLLMKRIPLPLGGSRDATASTDMVRLDVGADGALSWNDNALLPALLREQLRVLASREPQPELRIGVAREASYQSFVAVLADAKSAHVERISVVDDATR